MKVQEVVNTSKGDIIEELTSLSVDDLFKVNRGLNIIQNLITDIIILKENDDVKKE